MFSRTEPQRLSGPKIVLFLGVLGLLLYASSQLYYLAAAALQLLRVFT